MSRVRAAVLTLLVLVGLGGYAAPVHAGTSTASVLMPFNGKWDAFGWAPPGSHLGDKERADWAVDIYAAEKTPVKVRVTVPKGSSAKLKVLSVTPRRCDGKSAGTTVEVEIQADGKALGWASYGHLDQVPSGIKPGAVIAKGAVLGKLKLWPYSGCWMVTTPSGVHTHFSLASYRPNVACYRPLKSGKAYSGDTWVGQVGKTKARGKKQAC